MVAGNYWGKIYSLQCNWCIRLGVTVAKPPRFIYSSFCRLDTTKVTLGKSVHRLLVGEEELPLSKKMVPLELTNKLRGVACKRDPIQLTILKISAE